MASAYHKAIKSLRRELADLEARAARIRAAIETMEQVVGEASKPVEGPQRRRSSPMLKAVADILRVEGKPLHMEDLVRRLHERGIGNPDRRALRLSLTRSLDRKVSRGDTFIKPYPATYYLKDVPVAQTELQEASKNGVHQIEVRPRGRSKHPAEPHQDTQRERGCSRTGIGGRL